MSARAARRRKLARERVFIQLRPGADDAKIALAMRCLRRLVPHAEVVVAPAQPPPDLDATVVTMGADELAAGPLVAAAALVRERLAASRTRMRTRRHSG
jgi:hypothetical protein